VAATLLPVAEALAELHGSGWVHGDVSAANVVVGPDGAGVLIDFDRAAPIGAARATGTPGFVAPEVEAGAPVTPAADVWSLAAVARAATTGPCPEVEAVLAAGPADRPAELVTLFAGAADPRAATTRDYGPKPPAHLPRPPAPRRSPLAAAAVLAAAVLAGVLAALARAGPSSAPPDVGVVVEPSGGSDRVPVVPPG
jgi:serine/threonine protein kinase